MNKAHKLSISNGAKPNCRNWKSTKQSRKQVFVEEDECTRKVSDSSCPIRTKYVKTNIGDVMLLSNSPTENRGLRQFSRAGGFRYLWNDEMNSKVCKFVQFFLYNSKVCSFIFLPVIWHLLRRVVEVSRSFCYTSVICGLIPDGIISAWELLRREVLLSSKLHSRTTSRNRLDFVFLCLWFRVTLRKYITHESPHSHPS